MDRPWTRDSRGRRRFPRPRGDGPAIMVAYAIYAAVSPPTRGWTPPYAQHRLIERGFPAHAGMDLPERSSHSDPRGFPRPRGDGPLWHGKIAPRIRVSPPTRGWTAVLWPPRPCLRGFPAHAGMDLSVASASVMTAWFPRPRGDGPVDAPVKVSPPTVSPPTRGWTAWKADRSATEDGFPAHAGMDPRRGRQALGGSRFPRPRGDGPL